MTLATNFDARRSRLAPALACLAAAILSACGGGGGGEDAPSSGGITPPAPPPPSTAIVTTVPAATYAAGTAEKAAFDWLNDQRGKCGFGLLAQDAKLDVAAAGMANYIKLRTESNELNEFFAAGGHTQVAGKTGFTGLKVRDRISVASTDYSGSEVAESTSFAYATSVSQGAAERGLKTVSLMAATVYHAGLMFGGYRDVGLGQSSAADAQAPGFPLDSLVMVMGHKAAPKQAPTALATWPCQGVTAEGTFAGESPSPLPAGWTAPAGTPIYVLGAGVLNITGWSVSLVGGAAISEVHLLTASNDSRGYLKATEAFLIPRTPLSRGSSYDVLLSGTDGGVMFSRQFRFTAL